MNTKEAEYKIKLTELDVEIQVGYPTIEDIVFFKLVEQLAIYYYGLEPNELPFKIKIYVRE